MFKEFGGVNAVPICLDTQDTEEIIKAVTWLAPAYGGINLEDISAPVSFAIFSCIQLRPSVAVETIPTLSHIMTFVKPYVRRSLVIATPAGLVPDEELSEDNIMPEAFNPKVAELVAEAVKSHIIR